MTTVETTLLVTAVLTQTALAWALYAARRTAERLETRLDRHGDALSLMTETSEAGFTAVARELERVAASAIKPARRTSTRRVATAARSGRSINEIAAQEGVSEGEVRLRLRLSEPSPGARA